MVKFPYEAVDRPAWPACERKGKAMSEGRTRYARRAAALLLSLALMLGMAPATVLAAGNAGGSSGEEGGEEASYAPGEVIVMFEDGAVSETKTSLSSARSMRVTGEDFGAVLEAAGDGEEAAEAAKSEAGIIEESLGGGFVIEDSLLFENDSSTEDGSQSPGGKLGIKSEGQESGGLRIALVSSDRYSTEEMIAMLSENPAVAAVEPNSYLHYEDYDSYSLNDEYASYLYQDNAPAAENRGGDSVSARGADPDAAISANAASGWKKLSGSNKEVVVAVVDTGINLEHEDLVNRLWTNPGDIGLAGEHGYNFADNNTDIMDHEGHGTHCAGLVAAEANNGKGVAGVAGEADVKIMMLKTSSDTDETRLYTALGSFNYVLKARQRGVNVVATSNSWGRSDSQSTIFNAVVDRMGEGGILTFTAAGNSSKDLDRNIDNPASNESEYGINVGAAGINGKPAGFSNYGKTSVDVFASGVNTLSTVGYKCYMPNIYDKSGRRSTTEYFGKFTSDSKVSKDTITPYTPDKRSLLNPNGMKSFGAFEFHKQEAYGGGSGEYVPSDAGCELTVVRDRYFTTGDKAASLKVTIHGATAGEEYCIFFPFDKNRETTGKNTRFSIMYQSGNSSGGGTAEIFGGEIYKDENGIYRLTGGGERGHAINAKNDGVDTHLFNDTEAEGEYAKDKISAYKKGEKTGIGLVITPEETGDWETGTSQDLVLYIDSVAVSKPGAGLSLSNAYEMMSGTSMACPSAAGACALMASLYPKSDSQTDAEYAAYIRNKLFSCVRQTDELADLCATGGYIDFRLLTEPQPVIDDAVCDTDAGTLTLYGENMDPGMKLTYRRLAQKGSEAVTLPEEGMSLSYAGDGKSVVIGGAESLFGSYLEFEMKGDGDSGKRSFFTVKGQNEPEVKMVKHNLNPAEDGYTGVEEKFRLFTDAAGSQLFAMDNTGACVNVFNGRKFVRLNNGSIRDALTGILAQEYDDYELTNNIMISVNSTGQPVVDGDRLYSFVSYTYNDTTGSGEQTTHDLIGVMDLSAEDPEWTFEEDEAKVGGLLISSYAFLNGRLYFAGEGTEFSSYDPASKTISPEADLPEERSLVCLAGYNGNLYMMFGADWNYKGDDLADSISDRVYRYDTAAKKWELVSEGKLKYIGRFDSGFERAEYQTSVAATDKGIAVVNMSVDGAGNVSVFDPEKDTLTPLYYTFNDGLSDQPLWGSVSCVTTKDGIYYMRDDNDEMRRGYGLWLIPASAYGGGGDDPAPAGPVSIQDAKVVLSADSLTWNGKKQKPAIVTVGGRKLISGTDYTAKWSNASSKNVGSYTVTITGKGSYTGTTKAVYKINPKGTSVKSLKKAKKAVTVRWKKQSSKMSASRITGYQIQLATDKKFTRNRKTVTVKGYKNTSRKVKNLKGKKKYYVRVRTYKTAGGKKYCSPWSKVKTVKTK